MFGVGAAIAVVCAGVAIGIGVAVGMSVSGSAAADATKYAADQQAGATKHSADAQQAASDHEADLLFQTEQADRDLDEKRSKEDSAAEAEMMGMFDSIDEISYEETARTDRAGQKSDTTNVSSDEYYYPEPADGMSVTDDDMSFS